MKVEIDKKTIQEISIQIGEVVAEKILAAKEYHEPLLTIQELSKKINISPSGIYHLVHRTNLPHTKLGRTLRFKFSDVDRWISAR